MITKLILQRFVKKNSKKERERERDVPVSPRQRFLGKVVGVDMKLARFDLGIDVVLAGVNSQAMRVQIRGIRAMEVVEVIITRLHVYAF